MVVVLDVWIMDCGAGGVDCDCGAGAGGVDCGCGAGDVDSGCGAGGVDSGCGAEDEERSLELELYNTRVMLGSPQGESPLDNTVHSDATAEMPQTQKFSPQTTAVRRSTRQRQVPDYYCWESTYVAAGHTLEPKTLGRALTSAEKHHWVKAMEREMKSLQCGNWWNFQMDRNQWATSVSSSSKQMKMERSRDIRLVWLHKTIPKYSV